VCANEKKSTGFLNDSRRLNVAITRAKNSQIVLGNRKTLEHSKGDIGRMIVNLRERQICFTESQLLEF
jgi:superfamily I DNA and/or RNA helicase